MAGGDWRTRLWRRVRLGRRLRRALRRWGMLWGRADRRPRAPRRACRRRGMRCAVGRSKLSCRSAAVHCFHCLHCPIDPRLGSAGISLSLGLYHHTCSTDIRVDKGTLCSILLLPRKGYCITRTSRLANCHDGLSERGGRPPRLQKKAWFPTFTPTEFHQPILFSSMPFLFYRETCGSV